MAEEVAREEQLKLIQDNRVYPVGRVLRDTFDAENHDSLGSDVAGLMINLSRVPYTGPGRAADEATPPKALWPEEPRARGLKPHDAERGPGPRSGAKHSAERPGVLRRLQQLLLGVR